MQMIKKNKNERKYQCMGNQINDYGDINNDGKTKSIPFGKN